MKTSAFTLTFLDAKAPTATGHCPRCGFASSFASNSCCVGGNNFDDVWTYFMVCRHCNDVVMVDAKPWHSDPGRKVVAVYPRSGRVFPFPDFTLVAPQIQAALGEAYKALGAGAFTLVGLGCRVVLERLVQGMGHRDVDASNSDPLRSLEARLDRLRGSFPDLIGPLVNADIVRLMGNAAAHDAFSELTQEQALAVIEFTEEILRAVYIAPKKRANLLKAFPDPKKTA